MVFLLLLLLCGEEVVNAVHNNTQRGTQKKVEKGAPLSFLTRPFFTFLTFYRTLHLETYALTRFFSKSASWCVFSLSLILLFYCYHCAWCEDIYRERDERGNLEPTREKQKKRSRGEFYFSRKALLLQNIFSSKPNHHRALERNER